MGPALSDDQVCGVQAVRNAGSAYFEAEHTVQTSHTSSGLSSMHAVQACSRSEFDNLL
jgi:hypothetical protein